MPRIVLVPLLSAGCLAGWSPCTPDEGSLLAEGGFPTLQCWDTFEDPRITTDGRSGTPVTEPAVRIDDDGTASLDDLRFRQQGGNALMRDTLYVPDGTAVLVKVWVTADTIGRPFQLRVYDAASPDAPAHVFDWTADTEWREVTFRIDVLPESDLIYEVAAGGQEGTVWFDLARLEPQEE